MATRTQGPGQRCPRRETPRGVRNLGWETDDPLITEEVRVKTRQFHQLMSFGVAKRLEMLSDGLDQIVGYLGELADELTACGEHRLVRSSVLLRNVTREETGKFLILVDSCRTSRRNQRAITDQLTRAGDHLSKLIYAQIADYSLGSQKELTEAVELHRKQYHLDGPNGADFIMPNWLITEREAALYVDLVDYDGVLEWSGPFDRFGSAENVPKAVLLVLALHRIGATSPTGLQHMYEIWRDFDPTTPSHHSEWVALNRAFVDRLAPAGDDEATAAAQFVIREWPMPMVGIDVGLSEVDLDHLRTMREAELQAQLI
jgi:hypothetical protein